MVRKGGKLSKISKSGLVTTLVVGAIAPSIVVDVNTVHAAEPNAEAEFTYIVTDGKVTITSYIGVATDVIIPSTIGGNPVTAIGTYAFSLNTAENPDGKSTTAITSVQLPSSLESIEESAFAGTGITSLELSGLTLDLGENAFAGTTLKSISAINSNIKFAQSVFAGTELELLSLNGGNYDITEGAFQGISAIDEVTISAEELKIGNYSFNGTQIGKLSLNTTGELSIGEGAFMNINSLSEVDLKGTSINVGTAAFYMSKVGDLEFQTNGNIIVDYMAFSDSTINSIVPMRVNSFSTAPHSFANFKTTNGEPIIVEIESNTFINLGEFTFSNAAVKELKVKGESASLGNFSFKDTVIDNLDITAKDVSFGEFSFDVSPNLTQLDLDVDSVTMGQFAFRDTGIKNLNIHSKKLIDFGTFAFANTNVENVSILAEGKVNVGEYAWKEATKLKEFNIEGNEIYFDEYAFMDLGLETLNVKAKEHLEVDDYAFMRSGIISGVFESPTILMKSYIFQDSSLQNINLAAEDYINIGYRSFASTPSLESMEMSGRDIVIGSYAFQNTGIVNGKVNASGFIDIKEGAFMATASLDNLELKGENIYIGAQAFLNSTLPSISLDNVVNIGDAAFLNNNLSTLNVPKTVKMIGKEAFLGGKLSTVTIHNPTLQFGTDVFKNNPTSTSDPSEVLIKGKMNSTAQVYAREYEHSFEAFWSPVELKVPLTGTTIKKSEATNVDLTNFLIGDIDSYSVTSDSTDVDAEISSDGLLSIEGLQEGVANLSIDVLGKDGNTLTVPFEVTVVENENLLPPKLIVPAVVPVQLNEGETTPAFDIKSNFESKLPSSLKVDVISEPDNDIVTYTLGTDGFMKLTGVKYGTTAMTILATDDNGVGDAITLAITVNATSGKVTIEYADTEGNILDVRTVNNAPLGVYTSEAKAITGYTVIGDTTKTVTLTPTSPTATLRFEYKASPTSGGGTSGGSGGSTGGGSSPSTPNPTTPLTSLSVVKYLDKSEKLTVTNKGVVLPLTKLDLALRENVLQFSMQSEDKKIDLLRNPVVIELDKDNVTLNANKKEFASTIDLSKWDLTKVRLGREEEKGKYTAIPHFVKDNKLIVTTSHVEDIVLIKEKAKEFNDIADVYSKDEITKLQELYIVSGTAAEKTYNPWASITRGQFAGMIASALELEPLENETKKYQFKDTANHWYAKDVQALFEAGIINGYENGEFGGQDNLTRQQAMAIIGHVLKYVGVNTKTSYNIDVEDYSSISGYARESINFLAVKGILQEGNGIKFNPHNKLNRAQMAGVLMKALELSEWY